MYEWLWLLLPVAAASGWLTATRNNNSRKNSEPNLPSAYVKGLNLLLDKQHGKAVDTFVELFQVNPDTVETHIILGNLYRQRGEIEKAIRIHQNVIAKQSLTSTHRANALLELGRDYFDAGLLDRSEKLFKEVISFKISAVALEAYQRLNTLYEIEKSWDDAIAVAKKLQKLNPNDSYNTKIAHYYCELAELALSDENYNASLKYLAKAEVLDSVLLRSDILRGDIYARRNDFPKALNHYKRAFSKHPDFAILLLPKIQKVLAYLPLIEASAFIKKLRPSIISVSYLKAYIWSLLRADLKKEVSQFFEHLNKNGNVPIPVLRIILQHKLNLHEVGNEDLIKEVITSLESNDGMEHTYQCSNCGFQSCENHWLCPSCARWDMVVPCDVVPTQLSY